LQTGDQSVAILRLENGKFVREDITAELRQKYAKYIDATR
jgi:hypothetical protein